MKNKRFSKGTSGNPKGRPKKIKTKETTKEIYDRLMEKEILIDEHGCEKKITLKQAIARKAIALAGEGNGSAMNFIFQFLKEADSPKFSYLVFSDWIPSMSDSIDDVRAQLKKANLIRKQKGKPKLDFDTVMRQNEAYPMRIADDQSNSDY